MQINRAVLQILDFSSSLAVYSENELNMARKPYRTMSVLM